MKDDKMEDKISKLELNENNVKVLLQIILSILTDKQLEKLSGIIEGLEAESKVNPDNEIVEFEPADKPKTYIG